MPRRLRVPPCSMGRHAVLLAGLLPRQVPPLMLALLSVVGVPAFSSAPTVGSPRCSWVGGAGGAASSSAGYAASRAWPSDMGGVPGRLPGPVDCGASARTVVRAGSGPGSGLGAGRPGDYGSAGRAVGTAGGSWCRWDAGSACVVSGRSPGAAVLDIAGTWGSRPSVGSVAWGHTLSEGRVVAVSVGLAACACVEGSSGGTYAGPVAGRLDVPWRGRGSGWACIAAAGLAAGWRPCADAPGGVSGCRLPVGLGVGSLCGCAVPGGCSGRVPTAPIFVGLGTAPLPAGDARCLWIPVAAWCCGGGRCAAPLDARSCRGLCGVLALDGAGASVVRVASAARCWCGVATGVWGAEVDGPEDVEAIAADRARARTFVALVAVVARDRGGRLMMVAVLREEEDESWSRVPLAIILATAALPYVPGCGGGMCGCWARCASGRRLPGRGMPLHVR